ncbi:amidohydrolase family protein [Pseudooceanicola sp. CBS1P-1]|uniref:Amidohydrolase family protein n=1 Tax=Pseudooceanicola albus TaxID=2692189 RepID=A0A6L7GA72_9RHOB|nr:MULTISPECIES: amidohydrolase family protein [Pseudooceanicola]MBT9385916.1 amidohydrolase family protein [Pseudooceanicola endophyticus]MXN19663.1 amidohydrolase family protein [Pseudooceanicola albus]
MHAPFILDNVRLADGEVLSIRIEDGVIAAMGQGLAEGPERFDAQGALLSQGFTDAHVHLDKALLLEQCPICEGTLPEAVRLTAAAKRSFTEEDVHARASRVIEMAVRAGTQRMRSFVEVDPRAGLRSFAALKRLKADWADLIDLQLCIFAQEGLTQEMETYALIDRALAEGGDLVGGCPYTDADPVAHVSLIFDLAEQHDVDVDFHADFDLDPEGSILPEIIAQTLARGWRGRVAVGHATKFAAFSPERREALARQMAGAGIALVVLPATDSFLNGDRRDPLRPRGLAPAHQIAGFGTTVALATNNVQNPFTPHGDAALLRMANLYASLDQLASEGEMAAAFGMITTAPAQILRASVPMLAVGAAADFVLLGAESPAHAVRTNAPVRAVVRGGVLRLWAPAPPLVRG